MNKINRLTDGLDKSVVSLEGRLDVVNNILKENDDYVVSYFDNHYNCDLKTSKPLSENLKMVKDLEKMADYLLYLDNKNLQNTKDELVILNDYKKKRNKLKEADIENVYRAVEEGRKVNRKQKTRKIKVYSSDREEFNELKETGKMTSALSKMISERVDSNGKNLSETEVKRLKWIRTDIQKDEIVIKDSLKGYIRFNSILKPEKDLMALSHIRFDDAEIIRLLIKDYKELKEQSKDDTFGYLKFIIQTFDELIEQTEMTEEYKIVLESKKQMKSYDHTISELQKKLGTTVNKAKLSKLTRYILPKLIAETYKQTKEDWIFTHKIKGNYVKCSDCDEVKVYNKRNFYMDNPNEKQCINCVGKKRRRKKENTQ